MFLMAVHSRNTQKTHDMQSGIIVFDMFEQFVEGGYFFILPACNGLADARQVRFDDSARAYGHMAHLAPAYHPGQKTDMFAARL